MEEREICVDELSEKSGIICNDLEKILADKKVINPYEIACIAGALGLEVNDLFRE